MKNIFSNLQNTMDKVLCSKPTYQKKTTHSCSFSVHNPSGKNTYICIVHPMFKGIR